MNYKQFVEIYKQDPEELYRLFKPYEKTMDSLNGQVESLSGKLHIISSCVSALEFQTKKTLQIVINRLRRTDYVNRNRQAMLRFST